MKTTLDCQEVFDSLRYEMPIGRWWEYDRGQWNPINRDMLHHKIYDFLSRNHKEYRMNQINDIIKFGRSNVLLYKWTETSANRYIPFQNGVLDSISGKLLPHNPAYGFRWQLPHDYTSDGDWSNIDEFINILTGSNPQKKDIAIAFCNAVLKGRSDLHKFLFLSGKGYEAKDAFIKLLRMLMGRDENTYSTHIDTLVKQPWETDIIKDRRLLAFRDESQYSSKIGIFPKLIEQQPIDYKLKYKKADTFIYTGMIVMSADKPVFLDENKKKIEPLQIDLHCPDEISYDILNALKKAFEQNLPAFTAYLVALPDEWVTATLNDASINSVQQQKWEQTYQKDSIATFFDRRLVVDPNSKIPSSQLYKTYKKFCDENKLKAVSIPLFTPQLFKICTSKLGDRVSLIKTNVCRNWCGIAIQD